MSLDMPFLPEKYCIIGIFPGSFDGDEFILLLSKMIELIFNPSMVIFCCITLQKCKDFPLF